MHVDSRWRRLVLLGALGIVVCGCGSSDSPSSSAAPATSTGQTAQGSDGLQLSSSAFEPGGTIADLHTTAGDDTSPPLAWSGAPAGTASFALICDDPDAPSPDEPADEPWVHWVIFNIPPDTTALPAGVSREAEPAEVVGARQGGNSWPSDNLGYRGPAPPPASGPHRYFFKLYALDVLLELDAGATKDELLAAMAGHILAEGELIGTFEQ